MRINSDDFRRHYSMLSDQALFALNRADLIDAARICYDEEVAKRKSSRQDKDIADEQIWRKQYRADAPIDEPPDDAEADLGDELFLSLDDEGGPPPEWLAEAACVCTFTVTQGSADTPELATARTVLRTAGIPCHITVTHVEATPTSRARTEYALMVPGGTNLHATSVLDRDLFNAQQEADWRAHLEELTDDELRRLNPEIFCAGLLDRAARLKSAFEDEIARRRL